MTDQVTGVKTREKYTDGLQVGLQSLGLTDGEDDDDDDVHVP